MKDLIHLGKSTPPPLPSSSEDAVLDRVPNPHAETAQRIIDRVGW